MPFGVLSCKRTENARTAAEIFAGGIWEAVSVTDAHGGDYKLYGEFLQARFAAAAPGRDRGDEPDDCARKALTDGD